MSEPRRQRSLGERVVASVLWMGAWRWTARVLGFASTIVIARLLLPEDLGLVATALIVVGFFDTLVDLGTDKYLIRLPDPERGDYDTAWTLRLIVLGAASAAIFLCAHPAAAYFGEPRLAAVLQLLAMASLLRGFTNIGLTVYRRDLQFGRIALIGIAQRVVGVAVTVVFAFVLQNYWAIVLGEVAFRVAEVLLSYLVQPYRPRFGLARCRKQWDFCKWLVSRNVARFAQARGDQFVVAKFFGVEAMGFYAMGLRLAELPSRVLTAPMVLPVYAGLAKQQDDRALFARSVVQVTGATAALVLPAATLVAALGEPLVLGLFGAKWQSAVPLVVPLAFTGAAAALAEPAATTLTLVGRVKFLAMLEWGCAVLAVGVMVATAQLFTLEQFAYARMVLALGLLCVGYGYVASVLKLPWRRLAGCIYRPLAASAAMAAVIAALAAQAYGTWPTIVLGGAAGCTAYLLVGYALWRAAASPDAGEALLLRKFAMLIGRNAKNLGT
jgi:O-antigen/teichoic acid export membrane protein